MLTLVSRPSELGCVCVYVRARVCARVSICLSVFKVVTKVFNKDRKFIIVTIESFVKALIFSLEVYLYFRPYINSVILVHNYIQGGYILRPQHSA